jgi:hypothetical protein
MEYLLPHMHGEKMDHKPPKKVRNAPLMIQFDKGKYAFKRGWISNPYSLDTAQGKEWQRGFNTAYFERLFKQAND